MPETTPMRVARPPDPPFEIPSGINVARMYTRRVDTEEHGPSCVCPGCLRKSRGELCPDALWLHTVMGAVNAWKYS